MPKRDGRNNHVIPVTIAGRRIGPGERTFIVAEAGVNHNGCVDTALRMIDTASDAGADAVKFQMFRADDLVTAAAPVADYQARACSDPSQRTMLSRLELARDDFLRLKQRCDDRSILFLATPFDETAVRRLTELGAPAIKVASTDLTNLQLLEAAVMTHLPLIVSTGAASGSEIRGSVRSVFDLGAGDRLVLLHCVSCYPTPMDAANLRAIRALEESFHVPCGLSDHTRSTETGGWAVAGGACVVEKHFTLDAAQPGPDHAMSLTPTRLAEYIETIRRVERALGTGTLGMTALERDVRDVAGRSVVTAVDVKAGTVLARAMLTLKRPGTGIPCGDFDRLIGRRAAVDLMSDTLLSWEMVE